MMIKILQLCLILLLGPGLCSLSAQQTIPASGGKASGTGGSVSYSIGQMVFTTIDGGINGKVAQGVQHPFEIFVVSGTEEAAGIELIVSAYPNPTNNVLMLKVEAQARYRTLEYELLDAGGALVVTKKIESTETVIMMDHVAPAIYFLNVKEGHERVKTFKIIKN